ncbi:MAG: saccharopine dehydrogenase NADP-binding domain-containing protein [archaeon YNP-LCB-003-016]|jgi:saccharopine dehydrogenase-like NADP-dependent oxidoreductase|uniref:saccharopine dehydrogenase family protein n=1 Tax=Candidatus Culexarchaeum yellowstonense TaxID=2928963 RepID=UPI0026E9ACE7|nr:saccharopine dehydrogenase NADP-binding domain-containing protein [Candidatus Culexarchaeum yellowstonense]MCR6691472.1 saccharopine dehydrogenase NADP-binding domain-containing protein [Candidatus Culexarchaeum yellowstonense]
MKIAVIGATGTEGMGIVRDLLSKWSSGVSEVLAIGRNLKRLEDLKHTIGDERLKIAVADATDKPKLVELLKGVQACVNAAQYYVNLHVMEACLEAGAPYLDLGGMYYTTLEQKKLHDKFVRRGIPAILGMGSAPGTTNILAKYAADQLDVAEIIRIYDAIKFVGPESQIFIPPYSIRTLLEEFSLESVQFINGESVKLPPRSGKEVVEFPPPFGKVECQHTLHSETATLPYTLKAKGVKEVTWRLGLPDEVRRVAESLVAVGFGVISKVKLKDIIIDPVEVLENLIRQNIEEHQEIVKKVSEETKSYEIIRVIAIGEKDGGEATCTVDLIKEPQKEYEGFPDPMTAMPASIGAQMLARGGIPPGVWAPEECIDPKKYFEEMKKRKFKITVAISKVI